MRQEERIGGRSLSVIDATDEQGAPGRQLLGVAERKTLDVRDVNPLRIVTRVKRRDTNTGLFSLPASHFRYVQAK
jgi:hypothetical protein